MLIIFNAYKACVYALATYALLSNYTVIYLSRIQGNSEDLTALVMGLLYKPLCLVLQTIGDYMTMGTEITKDIYDIVQYKAQAKYIDLTGTEDYPNNLNNSNNPNSPDNEGSENTDRKRWEMETALKILTRKHIQQSLSTGEFPVASQMRFFIAMLMMTFYRHLFTQPEDMVSFFSKQFTFLLIILAAIRVKLSYSFYKGGLSGLLGQLLHCKLDSPNNPNSPNSPSNPPIDQNNENKHNTHAHDGALEFLNYQVTIIEQFYWDCVAERISVTVFLAGMCYNLNDPNNIN